MNSRFIVILQKAMDENFIEELNKTTTESVTNGYSRSNSVLQLIGLSLLLILILVAAYYTSKFLSKLKLGHLNNSNFKIIDTFKIGANKDIMIVEVGKKYIVIAVTKDQIHYLTQLEEDEIKLPDNNLEGTNNFKKILDNMKNTKSKG